MEPLDVNWMDELLPDFCSDVASPTPHSGCSTSRHRAAGLEEHRRQSPPCASIVHPSLLDGSAVDPCPPQGFVEEELEWISNKEAFPTLETFDVYAYHKPSPVSVLPKGAAAVVPPPLPQRTPRRARSQGRRRRRWVLPVFASSPEEERQKCWHCGAAETPQWRAGPHGPKTLCNACGVRYKSGRLVPEYRPASSPTFSSALHSNSHRKIMEMRRRKEAHAPSAGATAATTSKKKKRKRKGIRLL